MSKRPGLRWKSISLDGERRLTAGLAHYRCPTWSRDGKRLAFAVADTWVVVDRRGRIDRMLDGSADGGASFGAAGGGCDAPLAYGRRIGAASEIWLSPGGGAPSVRLLGGDGRVYREPAFSPDGRRLAYACGDEGAARTQLHLLELSTGERRLVTADPTRSDGYPAFSPDGEQLYFEGAAEDDVAVFALDLARNQLERVTPADVVSRRPAPISSQLVLVERAQPGDRRQQLVLVDRVDVRERAIAGTDGGEKREPAVHLGRSGKVRLAYTALSGEPRRFEVCVARLRGVSLGAALDDAPAPMDEQPRVEADTAA
jgi:Tol biopolymer transport system component